LIRWTRNDRQNGLRNGEIAKVLEIQVDGNAKIQLADGNIKEIDLNAQRHWDHGYATTIFSSQGRTCDHVLAVMPSKSPLSDQKTAYVAISRAKESAYIFTDDKAELVSALETRSGEKTTALDMPQSEKEKETQKVRKHIGTKLQQNVSSLLRDYAKERKEIYQSENRDYEHYRNLDHKFLSSLIKQIEINRTDKFAGDFSHTVDKFIKEMNNKVPNEEKGQKWKEFRTELREICRKKAFGTTRVVDIERPNWLSARNYVDG
jgi:hypothetical protein